MVRPKYELYARKQTAEQYRYSRKLIRDQERAEKRSTLLTVIGMIGLIALVMALGLVLEGCSVASEIPRDQAVKAIIGEAENQGFQGMLDVACGIKARNTLKGVYGLRSRRVRNHKYSSATLNQANLAWSLAVNDSHNCEFLGGATHWENIGAFGKPKWANSMVETYRYRDHVFYKVIK